MGSVERFATANLKCCPAFRSVESEVIDEMRAGLVDEIEGASDRNVAPPWELTADPTTGTAIELAIRRTTRAVTDRVDLLVERGPNLGRPVVDR